MHYCYFLDDATLAWSLGALNGPVLTFLILMFMRCIVRSEVHLSVSNIQVLRVTMEESDEYRGSGEEGVTGVDDPEQ